MSGAKAVDARPDAAPWHAVTAEEVETRLGVDPGRGLDAAEAAARLKTYGPNRLPAGQEEGTAAAVPRPVQ